MGMSCAPHVEMRTSDTGKHDGSDDGFQLEETTQPWIHPVSCEVFPWNCSNGLSHGPVRGMLGQVLYANLRKLYMSIIQSGSNGLSHHSNAPLHWSMMALGSHF